MTRIALSAVTAWITQAALAHADDLPTHLMRRLSVSRLTAQRTPSRLVAAQWLQRTGPARRPHYAPGLLRQVVQRYALVGLAEDLPWSRDFAPALALPPPVARLAQHAFGELLNNAIEHSGGTSVTVSMRQTPSHVQLLISDDGCGLFERVAQSLRIDDPDSAMLELSKGKLTSAPQRHSGRGLFFTSRIADVLDLHANHCVFQHRARFARPGPPRGATPAAVPPREPRLRRHRGGRARLRRRAVPGVRAQPAAGCARARQHGPAGARADRQRARRVGMTRAALSVLSPRSRPVRASCARRYRASG
nr:ATP-binding protein [uncultured Piscinibacter sp.]